MARPELKGLKYFPLDSGFFGDRKIRLLRSDHGADGIEVYLRLVAKCYADDNGYYLSWDEEEDYALMADETGYSEDKVRLIIISCLRRSLFDNTLFMVGNVLSSRGIQRRYFEAIKSTKIKAAAQGRYTYIEKELCLLSEDDFSELNKTQVWLKVAHDDDKSENISDKSEKNNHDSAINPLKERKGNKRKGNESKSEDEGAAAPTHPPKRKYGEFGWVKLSDEEYDRLVAEYGKDLSGHYIAYVDESAEQTGNKNRWKNWNLTVRKAIRGRWGGGPPSPAAAPLIDYSGGDDFFSE